MSDASTAPAPPTPGSETAADGTDENPQLGGQDLTAERDETTLPDWARSELTRARDEAARRRIELRELKDQLAKAADPEEAKVAIQEAHDRLATTELQLTRERLGRKYQLPDVLVARIQGEDEAAMDKDAKALAELAPASAARPPRPDRLQGGGEAAPLSAAEKFAQIIQTRLR
ncbi:hypothetical protein [Streptomyces indicus]|uniref:Scaffolding protein n=1 Tax=Streptomyces indicus TaxID=417292 RepID=A0A1G8W941_9ACTN|nr:hypothetical protein [Streptomyces indicus]SDJ74627.1 hypothetical protein SAMN05421806_102306 [Streptomyces indicus]